MKNTNLFIHNKYFFRYNKAIQKRFRQGFEENEVLHIAR